MHFAGEPCEIFHCVLESKSFLEKMTLIEHTLPFFLPIRELESDLLSSNAIVCFLTAVDFIYGLRVKFYVLTCFPIQKFIDHLEEILQAYIDRREQVSISY